MYRDCLRRKHTHTCALVVKSLCSSGISLGGTNHTGPCIEALSVTSVWPGGKPLDSSLSWPSESAVRVTGGAAASPQATTHSTQEESTVERALILRQWRVLYSSDIDDRALISLVARTSLSSTSRAHASPFLQNALRITGECVEFFFLYREVFT